jgi:putative SOS response-associated peptidase YedK
VNEVEGGRSISPMVWGIPEHRTAEKGRSVLHINARAEPLETRPLWRQALQQARCAVVADGFYEWSGAKKTVRQPFWFHRADDGLIRKCCNFENGDGGGPDGAIQ